MAEPRSYESIKTVVLRCEYPRYRFLVHEVTEHIYLQVEHTGVDVDTDDSVTWRGRKWLISRYATDGEIAQTCLKALLTALEHEAREWFTYRGVAVFDPHYDIEKLFALRSQSDSIKERDY